MITVITGPATEPVTLAEAKIDLRVDHSNDDDLITSLIVAARRQAEQLSGRAFITQTLEERMEQWPSGDRIQLQRPPLISVGTISYTDADGDSNTFGTANYNVYTAVEPGLVVLADGYSWPSDTLQPGPSIAIRYTAGYGTAGSSVPDEYRMMIRALVGIMYEHRDELSANAKRQSDFIVAGLRQDWGW